MVKSAVGRKPTVVAKSDVRGHNYDCPHTVWVEPWAEEDAA
jgi:hypothetical protein